MTMLALVGLLLPAGAAWLVLLALKMRAPGDSRALTAAVGVCAGLGCSSLLAFGWSVLAGGIGPWFAVLDALLWTTVGAMSWRRLARTDGITGERAAVERLPAAVWVVRAAFAVIAAIAAAAAATEYIAAPSGHPDATLIWNLKARFMVLGGDDWTSFTQVPWSSPSHPLLVPASVARLWAYAGAPAPLAPVIFGAAIAAATVAALVGALDPRRTRAWVAASVLVAPLTFGQAVAAQTADLPVALYLLVTLVLLVKYAPGRNGERPGLLLVTGLVASLVAWTKNEGVIVFLLALAAVTWLAARTRRRQMLFGFLAGAAPAIFSIAWLKLILAPVPPEYFADSAGGAMWDVLTDPARLELVGGLLWQHWTRWGTDQAVGLLPVMTLAAVVAGTRAGSAARRIVPVVGVMAAAYCIVWLLSPLDTTWLVSTTADRLLLQLWPSVVLAAFSAPLPWGTAEGNLVR